MKAAKMKTVKWHGAASSPTGIAIRAVVKDGIRAFLSALTGQRP